MCNGLNMELVVSKKTDWIPPLKHIRSVKYGCGNKTIWEQMIFCFYCIKNRRTPINLCGQMLLLYPKGITVIHDIRSVVHPEWTKSENFRSRLLTYWFIIQSFCIAKFEKKVATVSEFSRNEIAQYCHIDREKIYVIPNAWQHILDIEDAQIDFSVVFPKLKIKEYFFSVAAIAKHKNLKWIAQAAERNPESVFALSGMLNKKLFGDADLANMANLSNILYLGYVSDAELKTLIKNCRAFIYPSLYEGFGIPPLEALALGTQVISSNAGVFPEVLGHSVHYIDPNNYDVDLDKLLAEPVAPANEVLDKYSWERSANILLSILEAEAKNA
jgi:glycosyltransferase involved in cell wall biosynthesis